MVAVDRPHVREPWTLVGAATVAVEMAVAREAESENDA
jgi:hypothetical protein